MGCRRPLKRGMRLDSLAVEEGLLAGEGRSGLDGVGGVTGDRLGRVVGFGEFLAQGLELLLLGAEAGGALGSCGWNRVTHD